MSKNHLSQSHRPLPVPGPGTTPAGGGYAGPGERSGAHRRLVIQPGPKAAPAGATREMLAESRGSPEELSPRLAPPLPPRRAGLGRGHPLRSPRAFALPLRVRRLDPGRE